MLDLIGFSQPETDFGLDDSPVTFPVEERPLASLMESEHGEDTISSRSLTHKAIVNTGTNDIVGIVSDRYGLLTNADLFGAVEGAMRKTIPEDMQEGAQVRDASNGSWSRREYVFPAYAETLRNTVHETQVGLRIIASNSYDGSQSARVMVGLIDFYCTNGMVVGKGVESGARRHTSRITSGELLTPLALGIENAQGMVAEVQKMIDTPITEDQTIEVLEKSLSGRRAAELLGRFHTEVATRGQNVFALHSALTHYASHQSDYATRGDWDPRHLQGREDTVTRVIQSPAFRSLTS